MDHQQPIEKLNETKMRNLNTIKNTEDIYNKDIDYDEEIDQEELDVIIEYTERNPNCQQKKDNENDEDAEEGNETHDMKMEHPEE